MNYYPNTQNFNTQQMMNPNPSWTVQQNPYLYPYQQPMQRQAPIGMPGRMINNPDEVRPNEVPQDGSIGIFPLADMSGIYTKQWTASGLIETKYYPLAVDSKPDNGSDSEFVKSINERFDRLEQMINQRNNYKPHKGHAPNLEKGVIE